MTTTTQPTNSNYPRALCPEVLFGPLVILLVVALGACGGAAGDDAVEDGDETELGRQIPRFGIDGHVSDDISYSPCLIERRLVSDQTLLHRSERTYDDDGFMQVQIVEEGWNYLDHDYDVAQPVGAEVMRRDLFYSRDAQGRVSLVQRDDLGDGDIDHLTYYHRDLETGTLLYTYSDSDPHNGLESKGRSEYGYNEAGLLIERVNTNVDNEVRARLTYAYDEEGRLASLERDRLPDPADGSCDGPDAREKRFYDSDGNLVRLELDGHTQRRDCLYPVDGEIDLIVHYDRDSDGRIIQIRYDDGGDSSIERREERLYDCQ